MQNRWSVNLVSLLLEEVRTMRNKALFFGLLIFSSLCLSGQEWQLVWEDEFDGNELDTTKWSYQTGTGAEYGLTDWGNNELQYYREQNVTVSDGSLHIVAKRESYGGKGYTSGRIRTIEKGDWTYGRFEFRAKLPRGQGFWPAIWMLPTDLEYGGWAASGEIDIMENVGYEPTTVHGTLHFGAAWPDNNYKGAPYETTGWPFSKVFYDFALEWEEGEIRWYVNGQLFQTLGEGDWDSRGHDFPAPFDKRFHLLLNVAVGGNWPGDPDGTTEFPQEMVVEYVKVYKDASTGVENNASGFHLNQNHPNPVNVHSVISFTLPAREHVTLELYDSVGRKVKTLVDQPHDPGSHRIQINSSTLSSGLYSYRMQAGDHLASRQMVIL